MSTTPHSRRRIGIACAIFVLVGLTASALFGRFSFTSVCSRCGAIRDTTEWQIPLTSVTLFRLSSEHASAVSTVLASTGIVAGHEHKWLFCQGNGNGVRCAIGEGRHVRPTVESAAVAAVIAASERFAELQFRDRLLRALLDPKTSEAVRGLGTPTNGFADASAFRAWLAQETESFDATLALGQER